MDMMLEPTEPNVADRVRGTLYARNGRQFMAIDGGLAPLRGFWESLAYDLTRPTLAQMREAHAHSRKSECALPDSASDRPPVGAA